MSAVSTVEAPSNIAFIKYWGMRASGLAVPVNPSISMTLRRCVTRTTVELVEAQDDEVWLADDDRLVAATGAFRERACAHLERLREWVGTGARFRVATRNSFPAAAGIASSASGFAALTLAVLVATGRDASPEERSILARRSGSGSASRSVFGGYVEWPSPTSPEALHAEVLAPAEHWELRDVIAIVTSGPKEVSSLEGHRRAATSPFFDRRQQLLVGRLERVRRAILDRDLAALGPAIEDDAVELHLIAMSSRPPIFYWAPATLAVLSTVRELRRRGVGAWMTMDAGANVHVLCEPDDEPVVAETLQTTEGVREVLRDGVGNGPCVVEGSLLDLPRAEVAP